MNVILRPKEEKAEPDGSSQSLALHLCVQNIKAEPQAKLPEAQSDIKAVKRRNKEDVRSIQEEKNLHQQRGDLQDQMSVRVEATPLMKYPLSCFLQNFNKQLQAELQAELQAAEARFRAREKMLEEELKISQEKLNLLLQALEMQVSETDSRCSHQTGGFCPSYLSSAEQQAGWVMSLSAILLWSLSQPL